ncbi:hypothetical protein FACS1894206_07360 [Deltaproteobacteria bacterium]|nr:hypothetical protein FACS1894206_07360 [Deltaproteobacteria bacterium]
MIPCQVCGKDAATNWVSGYIPSSDNLKMALCPEHDSPEMRRAIQAVWLAAMLETIETDTKNAAYFATREKLSMLCIRFTAGGSISLPCLSASVTEQNTLEVRSPDAGVSFFPLGQITRYDLTPVQPAPPALPALEGAPDLP